MAETSTSPIARIDTAHIRDSIIVARVHGEIDLSSTPILESAADNALDAGRALVLDLDGVSFIGSTGLGVLVNTDRRIREAGLRWALIANNHTVARALRITGLDGTFPITTSVDTGIAALECPIPQQAG